LIVDFYENYIYVNLCNDKLHHGLRYLVNDMNWHYREDNIKLHRG